VRSAGAEYAPFDRADLPGAVATEDVGPTDPLEQKWQTILCTQVVQYVEDVPALLASCARALAPGGHLVMTYPTNWDEVEAGDLHRFTKAGMERLLATAGFHVVVHERRAAVEVGDFRFPLGYGVVARV
jgi:SAM-dependent methyltransferase